MRRYFTIVFLLLLLLGSEYALSQSDTMADAAFVKRLRALADSAGKRHYASDFQVLSHSHQKPVKMPEPEMRKRFLEIGLELPLQFTPKVAYYINLFQSELRIQTAQMFAFAPNYLPHIEAELRKSRLSDELKWLPGLLSFMNPSASYTDGYSGLWQLNYATAVFYNLRITSFIDYRRDPAAATKAGVKYLADLHSVYKDWELCLTAYLCGTSAVNKAIRRAGGNTSYSAIYEFLPPDYRDVVHAFTAVLFLAHQQKRMNLLAPPRIIADGDTTWIHRRLYFGQIVGALQIPEALISEHNPVYRNKMIPAGADSQLLILPNKYMSVFKLYRDSVFAYKDSLYNAISIQDAEVTTQVFSSRTVGKPNTITHVVKKGESLSMISRRYGVEVNEIKRWNKLKGNTLKAGQKLSIQAVLKPASSTQAERSDSIVRTTPANLPADTFYTVQSGDSFFSIARKYNISHLDLMKENNISDPQTLKAGQKLKIPRKP